MSLKQSIGLGIIVGTLQANSKYLYLDVLLIQTIIVSLGVYLIIPHKEI